MPLHEIRRYREVCYSWNNCLVEFLQARVLSTFALKILNTSDLASFLSTSLKYKSSLSLTFPNLQINIFTISNKTIQHFAVTYQHPIHTLVLTDLERKVKKSTSRFRRRLREAHVKVNLLVLLHLGTFPSLKILQLDLLYDYFNPIGLLAHCLNRLHMKCVLRLLPEYRLLGLQKLNITFRSPHQVEWFEPIFYSIGASMLTSLAQRAVENLQSITLDFTCRNISGLSGGRKPTQAITSKMIQALGNVLLPTTSVHLGLNIPLEDTKIIAKLRETVGDGLRVKSLRVAVTSNGLVNHFPRAYFKLLKDLSPELEMLGLDFSELNHYRVSCRIPVMQKLESLHLNFPASPRMKFKQNQFPALREFTHNFISTPHSIGVVYFNCSFPTVQILRTSYSHFPIWGIQHHFAHLQKLVFDKLCTYQGRQILKDFFEENAYLTVKELCLYHGTK